MNIPSKQLILEATIKELLKQIEPETHDRAGIAETPKRVAKAMQEWLGGYDADIESMFKTFEDGAPVDGGMVVVKDIPIYSKCEHHMADIVGKATIAYIPDNKVLGLSKFARVADAFARRLQVQERLTEQIADSIMQYLEPKGCAVRIEASHGCMSTRGVKIHGSSTVTTQLRGIFKTDGIVRQEWLLESK